MLRLGAWPIRSLFTYNDFEPHFSAFTKLFFRMSDVGLTTPKTSVANSSVQLVLGLASGGCINESVESCYALKNLAKGHL